MSLPRVGVVGSCVSRDPFNRLFAPEYKSKVELVETVYQSSMPSLVREDEISVDLPDTVRENFTDILRKEYTGRNLARIASAQADVLIVDFFADVHFGVTQLGDNVVTRNHMSFQKPSDADGFFKDSTLVSPDRMRYTDDIDNEGEYNKLALESMQLFVEAIRAESPHATIVLNSARMSRLHTQPEVGLRAFDNVERLAEKNRAWETADHAFEDVASPLRIDYPPSLFVSSHEHPWGLHAVHYTQAYYNHFWDALEEII